MKKVKICGITTEEELKWVEEAGADFAGMVVFFPKSKRNLPIDVAAGLIKGKKESIQIVAVVVSPTLEQVRSIEAAGFDIIQIHGDVNDEIINSINIPIFKAFNVKDLSEYDRYNNMDAVKGFVFDAATPGSGKQFDYDSLRDLPHTDKLCLLAGGLNPDNVAEALFKTGYNGADTSSGVENVDGVGKNKNKIFAFVKNARI